MPSCANRSNRAPPARGLPRARRFGYARAASHRHGAMLPWVIDFPRSSRAPATPAPPASATARASPRIRRASRRSATSTSSTRRSASLLAEPLPAGRRRVPDATSSTTSSTWAASCRFPAHTAIGDAHVARLEAAVERFNADLPPLKEFILPGGTRAGRARARRAHRLPPRRALARRARRRARRSADLARRYLNRLSDLLFVLARTLNRAGGRADVLWRQRRASGGRYRRRPHDAEPRACARAAASRVRRSATRPRSPSSTGSRRRICTASRCVS